MKSVRENCRLFGLFSGEPCVEEILDGMDLLQHRGQEYCGIATFHKGIRLVTHYGKVANSFRSFWDRPMESLRWRPSPGRFKILKWRLSGTSGRGGRLRRAHFMLQALQDGWHHA
jgi:hypothetical protein